jgi:hypothetical protein
MRRKNEGANGPEDLRCLAAPVRWRGSGVPPAMEGRALRRSVLMILMRQIRIMRPVGPPLPPGPVRPGGCMRAAFPAHGSGSPRLFTCPSSLPSDHHFTPQTTIP